MQSAKDEKDAARRCEEAEEAFLAAVRTGDGRAATAHGDEARIRGALLAGAAGYLLKDTRPDDVIRAVQAAHAGVAVPGVAGQAGSDGARS